MTVSDVAAVADLDDFLREREARVVGLRPGTEKCIRWQHADQRSTPLAIVYFHGFSASRQETAPLADQLATDLGANLFYTRLAGHGQSPDALTKVGVADWQADALEALTIGQRIGQRLIVMGSSTGATLATWLALQHPAPLHALLLLAPNFGLCHPFAEWITAPGGSQLLRTVVGETYQFAPHNDDHARYWTPSYPSMALIAMISLVQQVRRAPLENLQTPCLFCWSAQDGIVDAQRTAAVFQRVGSPLKARLLVTGDPVNHHVLAGDILHPDGTESLRHQLHGFLNWLGYEPHRRNT